MSEDLVSLLRNLAQINKLIEAQLENKKIADEALKQTVEYYAVQTIQSALKDLQEKDAALRELIRTEAMRGFINSGYANPKPIHGITIKHFNTVTIEDEKKAKQWLAENAPTCLSIKKSDTDRVLKALELPFVSFKDEWRTEIATDLSGYLPKEE